jgi:glutathione synthase/RimK-type ligase-like ATP-grasp enzyme
VLDPRPHASVALLTAASAAHLDEDLPLLVEGLTQLDLTPAVVDWHDEGHDWAAHDLVVVRSTWDYTDHLDAFLATLHRIAAATVLANPVAVIAANVDKRYLVRLAEVGIPVVPTTVLEVGDPFELPDGPFVVKPVVSAGARDTERYAAGEVDRARAHVAALHAAGRPVLVQPYVAAVDRDGETGIVHLADEPSHAFRKGPILRPDAAYVEGLYREEDIQPRRATAAEAAVADAVLDAVGVVAPGATRRDLLYARVDLVPGQDGPMLMELELVEPSLFLETDLAAPARAAEAIAIWLADLRAGNRPGAEV